MNTPADDTALRDALESANLPALLPAIVQLNGDIGLLQRFSAPSTPSKGRVITNVPFEIYDYWAITRSPDLDEFHVRRSDYSLPTALRTRHRGELTCPSHPFGTSACTTSAPATRKTGDASCS